MDIFDTKSITPMLIAEQQIPFNSLDYLYELKFDGIRTLLYSDAISHSIEIRNKRHKSLTANLPELHNVFKNIQGRVIIDGELIVMKNGKPNFYEIQKRAMMNNYNKIQLISELYPASFIAYDILYKDGNELNDLPLIKRKEILNQTVTENNKIAVSKAIEEKGIELFEITKQQGLEGVVAKRKNSKYFYGKRTKDWVKFKNMMDEDYVVLGYIPKQNNMNSLIIGQYNFEMELIYIGHVTLGVSLKKLFEYNLKVIQQPSIKEVPKGNEEAIWLTPTLVAVVEYMYNENNNLRQPVFKGFRNDKLARECMIK